jgi:DNA ligase-1
VAVSTKAPKVPKSPKKLNSPKAKKLKETPFCQNKSKTHFKKNKPPKCEENEDCQWLKGTGCLKKTPMKVLEKKAPTKPKPKKKATTPKKKAPTPTPKSKTKKKNITVPKQAKKCISGNTGSVQFKGAVLLAHNYEDPKGKKAITSPVGWWVSEKFDGYRSIWNGKSFVSRSGKPFFVPEWFSAIMPPDIPLDGEFWIGRDQFEECGIFRRKLPIEAEWIKYKVRYKVFDMPNNPKPFEERTKDLIKLIKQRAKCMKALNVPVEIAHNYCPLEMTRQVKAKSEKHVQKMLSDVVKKKGEGLMLRQPGSLYERKRSKTLLKIKKVFDDECVIIGYKPGTGKYKEKLGSFYCTLKKKPKIKFYMSGMNDEIRNNYKNTHPIGTIVTFQYNDVTKAGIPRHPRYMRIRGDHDL